MIVECIDDNWLTKPKIYPKKGEYYEAIDTVTNGGEKYYELRELGYQNVWNIKKFKEVDIDISDAESKKLNELPIEVLI